MADVNKQSDALWTSVAHLDLDAPTGAIRDALWGLKRRVEVLERLNRIHDLKAFEVELNALCRKYSMGIDAHGEIIPFNWPNAI